MIYNKNCRSGCTEAFERIVGFSLALELVIVTIKRVVLRQWGKLRDRVMSKAQIIFFFLLRIIAITRVNACISDVNFPSVGCHCDKRVATLLRTLHGLTCARLRLERKRERACVCQ